MGGGCELGSHLRVHGDHHLLLGAHDGVALFHLVMDPCSEFVAQNDSTDVDQPLLRDFGQVNVVWEEVTDVRFVSDEFEDAIDGQVLVLGHKQGLDLLVRNICFAPGQNVLQEVYGHIVCGKRAVRLNFVRNLPYGGRYTSNSPAKKL